MALKTKIATLGFFILAIFVLSDQAQAKSIRGDGRFYAKEEDGARFVRKQLIYSAIQDIITKELKAMKFDHGLFWAKYDEKFEEFFEPYQETLKKKYQVGKSEQTREQKKKFSKSVRINKLSKKRKFGNLLSILKSYSIKKISRSPKYPLARFLSMQAKVDRKALYQLYKKFVRDEHARTIKKAFLSLDFTVRDGDWSSLGVSSKSDFTDAVKGHWIDWLKNKSQIGFEEVEYAIGNTRDKIEHHLKNRPVVTSSIEEGQAQADVLSGHFLNEFDESIWIKIQVSINPVKIEELHKLSRFRTSGEVIIYDLKTHRPMAYKAFPERTQTFNGLANIKLAGQLASLIYKFPIETFQNLKAQMDKTPVKVAVRKIQIQNVANINELLLVQSLLAKKGVSINLSASYDSLSINNGVIGVEYQGREVDLKAMLLGLTDEVIGDKKKITFPYENNPFYILLSINSTSGRQNKRLRP